MNLKVLLIRLLFLLFRILDTRWLSIDNNQRKNKVGNIYCIYLSIFHLPLHVHVSVRLKLLNIIHFLVLRPNPPPPLFMLLLLLIPFSTTAQQTFVFLLLFFGFEIQLEIEPSKCYKPAHTNKNSIPSILGAVIV